MKNLNFISNDRNSNHFAYAKDKYLFNIKKERFLDFSMNSGVYFFGYNDVDVVSTLSTEIMSGLSFPGSSVNNSLRNLLWTIIISSFALNQFSFAKSATNNSNIILCQKQNKKTQLTILV